MIAAFVSVAVARSDVVDLVPVADTTLQEAFPDTNYGLNDGIRAGGRLQGGMARGLLLFDMAGAIPASATINSATLSLTVVATFATGVDSTFAVHRMLTSWGEGARNGGLAVAGEASWNNRLGPGAPWTTVGGDFDSPASVRQSVSGNGVYGFASAQLASDVQFWLTNAAGNFGWLLRSESETTAVTIRKFGSRNALTGEPTLTVDYSVAASPEIFALALIGDQIRFSFNAESNRTYAVEFRDTFTAGDWSVLTNIVTSPANTMLNITNPITSARRYFRVRTP